MAANGRRMQGSGNGLLMLLVGAALLGAMVSGPGSRETPAGSGSADGGRSDLAGSIEEGSSGSGAEDPGAQSVVLERSADGHFYAETQINGQTIRMLVDTGATAIALARDDARRAGVGISIGMPQVVGQGASGDVHGEVVRLERVALGGTEAEDLPALVLDEGQISLLGQNFLSRFESVEIKGDRMVLR